MGKVIRVTPEELDKTSKQMGDLSKNYSEISKQLMQQAKTMGEAWEGTDNTVFVEQITGFCTELEQMAEKLRVASETLNKQKENYITRQDNNITGVRKLTN